MEVHRILGHGLDEVVYKDALEYEFMLANIPYEREKKYTICYKTVVLPHYYFADFVVFSRILLEAKAVQAISQAHAKQTLNYLAISRLNLGLLINFGQASLTHQRIIL